MIKTKRGNNFRQIVQAVPEIEGNEDIKSAAESLDDLQSLSTLSQSEGGKILLQKMKEKSAGYVRQIIALSKTEHSHEMLLGMIARLDSTLDLASTLNMAVYNAGEQQDFVDKMVEEASQ